MHSEYSTKLNSTIALHHVLSMHSTRHFVVAMRDDYSCMSLEDNDHLTYFVSCLVCLVIMFLCGYVLIAEVLIIAESIHIL